MNEVKLCTLFESQMNQALVFLGFIHLSRIKFVVSCSCSTLIANLNDMLRISLSIIVSMGEVMLDFERFL